MQDHVFGIVDVAVQRHDQIDLVLVDQPQQLAGSRSQQLQRDTGILRAERQKGALREYVAQRIRHGDAHAAAQCALPAHAVLQFLGKTADLMRVFEHLPALFGQGNRVADPLKQLGVQLVLKLPDVEGYRGLRIAQFFRRPRKAAQLGGIEKGGQVFDIHAVPPVRSKISMPHIIIICFTDALFHYIL